MSTKPAAKKTAPKRLRKLESMAELYVLIAIYMADKPLRFADLIDAIDITVNPLELSIILRELARTKDIKEDGTHDKNYIARAKGVELTEKGEAHLVSHMNHVSDSLVAAHNMRTARAKAAKLADSQPEKASD